MRVTSLLSQLLFNGLKQEAQLSQRGRAMPRVVEYFGQSLKTALSRRINMMTFANLGSVCLPSLKFVGLCVRRIRRVQCVSCLFTTVSQLFEPQLQKIVIFTYPAFIFCLPQGRPCGNHGKRCMNKRKKEKCLSNPSQHVPAIFNSFPVIRTASAKNRRLHVPQPIFLSASLYVSKRGAY